MSISMWSVCARGTRFRTSVPTMTRNKQRSSCIIMTRAASNTFTPSQRSQGSLPILLSVSIALSLSKNPTNTTATNTVMSVCHTTAGRQRS